MIAHIRTQIDRAAGLATRDPKAALNVSRQVAEAVCKAIYDRHAASHSDEPRAVNKLPRHLGPRVDYLRERDWISADIAESLRFLQEHGNVGSHDAGPYV